MPSRNEHARDHARAWLREETPIADDASLVVLQDEAAAMVRDAKLRDPSPADISGRTGRYRASLFPTSD